MRLMNPAARRVIKEGRSSRSSEPWETPSLLLRSQHDSQPTPECQIPFLREPCFSERLCRGYDPPAHSVQNRHVVLLNSTGHGLSLLLGNAANPREPDLNLLVDHRPHTRLGRGEVQMALTFPIAPLRSEWSSVWRRIK
jgi:hypothetical protein